MNYYHIFEVDIFGCDVEIETITGCKYIIFSSGSDIEVLEY